MTTEQTTADTTTTQDAAAPISNIPAQPTYTPDDIKPMEMPNKVTMISTDDLVRDESTTVRRFKVPQAKIEELAKSIFSQGQIEPVVVRKGEEKGKYKIIAGESRTAAIAWGNQAGLANGSGPKLVAALVVDMSDLEAFTAGASENGKRNDMSPVDWAHVCGAYKTKYGLSNTEIGKVLGRAQSWVSEHIAILGLRAAIQKKIANGLSYTVVRELKDLDEAGQDAHLAALEGGETRDGAKAKHKAKKRKKGQEDAAAGGKTEAAVKVTLTMKEWRGMLANLAGIGVMAEAAAAAGEKFESPYSDKVAKVALVIIKALDGKVGEKALANKIDAA